MPYMSVDYFMEGSEARTSHQDNCAVLRIGKEFNTALTLFGPASAKDKFDQIAAIFNEIEVNEPEVEPSTCSDF